MVFYSSLISIEKRSEVHVIHDLFIVNDVGKSTVTFFGGVSAVSSFLGHRLQIHRSQSAESGQLNAEFWRS